MKWNPLKEVLKQWDGDNMGIYDAFTVYDAKLNNIKFKEANALEYKPITKRTTLPDIRYAESIDQNTSP